jgi:hypothetical protein
MWKFILAFIVVFCAGLIIRELMKPKTQSPPEKATDNIAPPPAGVTYCPNCGTQTSTGDNYCRNCGRKLN